MNLPDVLTIAKRSGIAHNNGAGGQYVLCATEAQLLAFAQALARHERPRCSVCRDDDNACPANYSGPDVDGRRCPNV